jgi:hypothetical protein
MIGGMDVGVHWLDDLAGSVVHIRDSYSVLSLEGPCLQEHEG